MKPALNLKKLGTWAAGTVLALLALAGLGLELQRARLERAVVDDWRTLPAPPTQRPTHVSVASPGSVGEAIAAAMQQPHPKFPREWAHGEPVHCAIARDEAGTALPEDCATVVDAEAAWARGVLASSRAADATLGGTLETGFETPDAPVVLAVLVASHDVRRAVARGEADAALGWCADAFGLGRDLALRQGPGGLLQAAHWAALLTAPCGEALDAASPTAKRTFADALDAIARALPPRGRILRQAVAERLVELYGATFSDATLSALPPGMMDQVRHRNPDARRFVSPLRLRTYLREAMVLRGTLAAADQGPAAIDAAIAKARARLADISVRELTLDALFERFDRLEVLLALLANAARLDAGTLSAAAPGLALVDEPPDRVLAPTIARLARYAVRLHPDGAPPTAAAPLH